jgi:hypothetical protein
MFHMKDDDLLLRQVHCVNDAILSISIPEQTFKNPLERRAQAGRILDKIGFDSFHNPGGILLFDHLEIMQHSLLLSASLELFKITICDLKDLSSLQVN